MTDDLDIHPVTDAEAPAVLALWEAAFPDARPWNRPAAYLARKRAQADELLLVGVRAGRVVAAVALGWDGVRGWVYHLAVDPSERRRGVGSAVMRAAEARLREHGCPKVNLQILAANQGVVAFYQRLGYALEPRISMGKSLAEP